MSYSSISNAFENNNIHLSDNKISSIASSPLNYVKEYANLLYNTRIKLENLKRNIGKSNTQEKSISNKTSSFEESKKDSDYSSIDTYSESVLSSSNERKVEEAKIIMDKYMNSKNNSSISYDELETLKKVYPEIADYGGLSTSSVENLIKIKQIMNRLTDYDAKSNINVMVNDMMKLGIYTVDVMQDYLYNDRKINKKFSSEYSVNALLSNYENSYNKFMKIYNKLDDSSKTKVTNIIENNQYYNNLFNRNMIVSREDIKNKINSIVSKKIVENYYSDCNLDNIVEYQIFLSRATSLMTIDEIVSIYEQIIAKREISNDTYTPKDEEDAKNMALFNNKENIALENAFASIIMSRLGISKNINTNDETYDYDLVKTAVIIKYLNRDPSEKRNKEYLDKAKALDLDNLRLQNVRHIGRVGKTLQKLGLFKLHRNTKQEEQENVASRR